MKHQHETKTQLEIGFNRESCRANVGRPKRRVQRLERARWWFRRMHDVVNHAWEWSPAPSPRPQQIYLSLPQGKRA